MATDTLSLLLSLEVQTLGENLLAGLATGLESLAGNAGNLTGLQTTLAGVGSTLTTVGVSAMAAGAALTAGVVGLAAVAGDFDAKLIEVRNNTTMLDGDAQTMRDTILQLGSQSPASLNALADGFMHASNMGFSAADAATVLNVAMESAVSTGGDVAKTTELLAQVMHEFKLPATEAAQAMDLMHLAAAEGNMTLEQFTESAGPVMAWAAALGVPLDQVSAAFSTMTRHGFDAARAATQVQDIFVHIIKPSQGAKDALEELAKASGVDLTDALSATNLNARGLPGILDQIHGAMVAAGMSTEEMTSEWMKLIPNIRGGAAAFVLTGQGTEDFKNILHDLDTQTGVTAAAYDRMKSTLPFEWGVLKNQVSELAISLGGAFLPAVQQIVTNIGPLLTQFATWVSAHKDLIAQVVPLAAALLLVGGAVVTVVGVVALIVAALNPVSLIILGIIAVVAALGVAWSTNFLGIRDTVTSVLAVVVPAIQDGVNQILAWFTANWPVIRASVETAMQAIQAVIQSVLNAVAPFVQSELNQITNWWINNHALIQQTVTTVMNAVQNIIQTVLTALQNIWNTFGGTITGIVTSLWSVVQALFTAGGLALQQIVQTDWDIIKLIVDTVIHDVLDILTLVMDVINGNWAGAWSMVQDIFATTWTAMGNIAKDGVNLIIGFVNDLIGAWDAIHLSIPGFSIALPSVNVPGVGMVGGGTLSWGGFSEGVQNIAPIPTLDSGGIVSGPTLAMLAMNSQPEVVAPLSSLSSLMSPGAPSGSGRSVTVVLTGNQFMGSLTEADVAYWGDKLSRYLNQQFSLYGQHA